MTDRPPDHYDAIVIGAGHNGLVCAAYLARSGKRVLVVEAAETLGGLAATREFHPGFRASVAHSVAHFSSTVARDLKLEAHGFKPGERLSTVALDASGNHVEIRGDTASGVSAEDARAYVAYRRMMTRFAKMLRPIWLKTMPPIGGNSAAEILTFAQLATRMRLMGKTDMGEFLRLFSLPVRDLMDENFTSDLLKTTLGWDGLIGSKLAPRSPNHAVLAMLYRMGGQSAGDPVLPAGGIEKLIAALAAAARQAGAEIRTGARVARIAVEGGKEGLAAVGVKLANGERILAERVVSCADPQHTLLEMVGTRHLEIGFADRIRRLRCEGYVAKLHLALDGLPAFAGLERPDGRLLIAPNLDEIEFAYDDAKYGACSKNLVMEILVPSLHAAAMAPEGRHVLSAHIMYVPYRRKGGWTEGAREALCERAIATLERYAPGLRRQIIARELLTPYDLEQHRNVTGGHWHHAEFALDQLLMMRPTYEAAQYATPIAGLYLCGAGCHPGGDITGAPGHNAAREILK